MTARSMQDTLNRAHALWRQRRFDVDIVRPDGTAEHLSRIGGSSMEHAQEGMERAGLGGVVRVREVEEVAVA